MFTIKPFILILVETKVCEFRKDIISTSLKFEDWLCVEAVGMSGGIWMFWNSSCTFVMVLRTHS